MYVEDVKILRIIDQSLCMLKVLKEAQNKYKHVFAYNFLNNHLIFNLEKVLES